MKELKTHWWSRHPGLMPLMLEPTRVGVCGTQAIQLSWKTARVTCERCRTAAAFKAGVVERHLIATPCPECSGAGHAPTHPTAPFCFFCRGAGLVVPCGAGCRDGHVPIAGDRCEECRGAGVEAI